MVNRPDPTLNTTLEIHNEGTSEGGGGNFMKEPQLLNSQDGGFEQFRKQASKFGDSTFVELKDSVYRKHPTLLDEASQSRQCPALDCSFDDENICQYMTFTEFDDFDLIMGDTSMKKLRNWDLSNTQVSNSLTGIPRDVTGKGFFAFAGNSDDPEENFVLITKEKVHVRNAAKLNFSVYMAGRKGRLRKSQSIQDNGSNTMFKFLLVLIM
uniref:Uncharacterized protein n=1 Tax=Acrobeloides nanus TaxID=290746 RepID=A0A914E9J9_9BILA